MDKITFITDSDETFTVEDPDILVADHGLYTTTVTFADSDDFPDEVRGLSPQTLESWDVVVTHNGETKSGSISSAEALQIRFNRRF